MDSGVVVHRSTEPHLLEFQEAITICLILKKNWAGVYVAYFLVLQYFSNSSRMRVWSIDIYNNTPLVVLPQSFLCL